MFGFMPAHILTDLLEWKQEYERLKQEQTEKEIAKTKQELSANAAAQGRTYTKKR